MSGNIKFRWFLLAPIVLALLFVVSSPVSWAEEMADKRSQTRLKQLQSSNGKKQIIKIDPIKAIREMNALGKYQEAVDMAEKVAKAIVFRVSRKLLNRN